MQETTNRKIEIYGRTRVVRLEEPYWEALGEYCRRENLGLEEACAAALGYGTKQGVIRQQYLSRAIRLMLVAYFREASPIGQA